MLKQDILQTYNRTSGGTLKRLFDCYRAAGVQAVIVFRFGNWLKKKNKIVRLLFEPSYLILEHTIRTHWGIEIPRATDIGEGFYIGHQGGIVVSGHSKIGENVNISHGVTLGVSGQGEKWGAPVIGNNVYIGPGAKVFGKITIGDNVKIGANAVIHKDIPDNAIVVLDPGFKIISYKGN